MAKVTPSIQKFIKFAARELNLKTIPHIHFTGHEEDVKRAFGHEKSGSITIRTTGRHPIDIMRTIAHELVHFKQGKGNEQHKEDQANAIAGRIMRKYDTLNPNAFKERAISEEGEISTPMSHANHTGANIANYDPMMMQMKMVKRSFKPKPLGDILGKRAELKDIKKARQADPFLPK